MRNQVEKQVDLDYKVLSDKLKNFVFIFQKSDNYKIFGGKECDTMAITSQKIKVVTCVEPTIVERLKGSKGQVGYSLEFNPEIRFFTQSSSGHSK